MVISQMSSKVPAAAEYVRTNMACPFATMEQPFVFTPFGLAIVELAFLGTVSECADVRTEIAVYVIFPVIIEVF